MYGENPVEVFGNFYSVHYTQAVSPDAEENVECYLWYDGDKVVYEKSEGVYGEAYYNKNGMLADGYIYSLEVALNILEDYYEAQEEMKELFALTGKTNEADFRAEIEAGAAARREDYYTGEDATEEDKFLWERENAMAADYSLTVTELNRVLNELGGALGSAKLLQSLLPTVESLLGGLSFSVGQILGMVLGNMPETIAYLSTELADLVNIKLAIKWSGNLQIVLQNLPDGAADVAIDLDENFSVATVKTLISTLGISNGMLAEIITMIGLEAKADDNSVAGLETMLAGLLENLYWYTSPVLAPEYDFYVDESLDPADDTDWAIMEYQAAYAKYKRAEYEGGLHGYLCGSRLIGSSLGSGNYGAAFGLQNLTAVRQLQTDLSYQPTLYSLLIVRDMLMTFAGLALFFTMMSYIAADREILWATGQIDPNKKKGKKGKKAGNVAENNEEVA